MYKQGQVWWTSLTYKGKRIRKSMETTDRKLAQQIEAKIRTEIVEGKYFEKSVGESKTLKEMMVKFMQEHAPTVSTSMQNSYTASLKHLLPYFGISKLTAITPMTIYQYKVLRKSKGANPATMNRELAMLSKAFNLAMKQYETVGVG